MISRGKICAQDLDSKTWILGGGERCIDDLMMGERTIGELIWGDRGIRKGFRGRDMYTQTTTIDIIES